MFVKQKDFNIVVAKLAECSARMDNAAKLIDISTEGSRNKFTFLRNGETFIIETYSTLRDDLAEWRDKAGLVR